MSEKFRKRSDLFMGFAGREKVFIPEKERATHMQIIGSTGTGKSKMLEYMIRQDILNRQGLCLIDPHASLYHNLVQWLEWNGLKRQVILFDPSEDGWVFAFNPLQRREQDLAFQMDSMVRACAKVWGDADMSQTPLLQRNLRNLFYALAEKGLTLVEALHLISEGDNAIRKCVTWNIADEVVREQWRSYNAMSPREFRETFASVQNRLTEFLSSERMRRIFGQSTSTMDFRKLMDEGGILLVNLSWGSSVSPQNARMLGTLLINDLFMAARNRPEGCRPFYLYIDECAEFANEDTAQILDQCRKWGLHLVLAHQHLSQLESVSKKLYQSVLTNAKTKLIFGGLATEDAEILAKQIFLGEFDVDAVKLKLKIRKVMDYREERRTVTNWSQSHTSGWSESEGYSTMEGSSESSGGSESQTMLPNASDPSLSTLVSHSSTTSSSSGYSSSSGSSESDSESYGESDVPFLVPIMGSEVSSVQFRSLEEQLYQAMALMVNQPTRHGLLKLPNRKVLALKAPLVKPGQARAERIERYKQQCFASVQFIKSRAAAEAEIAARQAELREEVKTTQREPAVTASPPPRQIPQAKAAVTPVVEPEIVPPAPPVRLPGKRKG